MSLPIELAYKFMKMAYGQLIRGYLADLVMQTKTDLDDYGLSLLDKIFDYQDNCTIQDVGAITKILEKNKG